jgi:uncharacterized membrane protein YeaQ/YmgE (transglycosylase-associated protein family)
MMDMIAWLVIGALAGWIASMIMKTDAQMGALANIVVGIIGAFIGGFLVKQFMGVTVDPNAFSIPSILTAVLGAVVLLGLVKLFTGRRA